MKSKIILFIILLTSIAKISTAQKNIWLFGPNLGYSVTPFVGIDSSAFNLPYGGLGLERTFGKRYRVGADANYYYAQKVKGVINLTPKEFGTAPHTTTEILEWSTITADVYAKKFFGQMREKAYHYFYTGLGATVAYNQTTNTIKAFNTDMYQPIANRKLDVITPYANVMFGYEIHTGFTSMLAPQVSFCIPVTNTVNTANLVMPFFVKMGVTYRWGRYYDRRWR
jgi:hypothetical protein